MPKANISSIMQKILTPTEVSEQSFNGKISYDTVLKRAKSNEIPCFKVGRKYFFSLDVPSEWARLGQVPA